MSGRRPHDRARPIALWIALGSLGAGAGAAHAQPAPPDLPPPLPPATTATTARPVPPPPPPLPPATTARPVPPPPPPPPPYQGQPPTYQGQPPTTYYPPPAGQQQYAPPSYLPPPAQTSKLPPIITDWEPDEPIPEGYRQVSKPNSGYLGIGIGMLSAGWVTAIVAAVVATDQAQKNKDPGGLKVSDWVPLYFPVAGPFITIATTNQGPAGMGLLLCDGIFQTAGLLGVILGATRWTHRLVRVGGAEIDLHVAPSAGPGLAGLQTIGHF
jgi:hypothetical protein